MKIQLIITPETTEDHHELKRIMDILAETHEIQVTNGSADNSEAVQKAAAQQTLKADPPKSTDPETQVAPTLNLIGQRVERLIKKDMTNKGKIIALLKAHGSDSLGKLDSEQYYAVNQALKTMLGE